MQHDCAGDLRLARGARLLLGFAAALATDGATHLDFRFLLGNCGTTVFFLAALCQGEVDLHATIAEMHVESHQRETFLCHAFCESADFGAVEQQFAWPYRFVRTDTVAEFVGSNMHVLQPHLTVRQVRVGIGDLHLSGANALYLAAVQHDASLDDVEDGEFVSGATIARQHGVLFVFLRHVADLSLGSVAFVSSSRLVITNAIEQHIVEHARACKPHEMCGLLVGEPGSDRALEFHPCRNAAASAIVYTLDPKDYMRVERDADDRGLAVLGVVHSHTHTEAYPSPTDVAQAPDPNWNYAIVSLKYDPPRLRNFRIVSGEISETALERV